MFRFDNPDALLVFLMTAAAYFVIRAIEGARTSDGRSTARRWLLLAGAGSLDVSAGWFVALVSIWPASARP